MSVEIVSRVQRGNFNLLDSKDLKTSVHIGVVINGEKTYVNLSFPYEDYEYWRDSFNDDKLYASEEAIKTFEDDKWILTKSWREDLKKVKVVLYENWRTLQEKEYLRKINNLKSKIARSKTEMEKTERSLELHRKYWDDINEDAPFYEFNYTLSQKVIKE